MKTASAKAKGSRLERKIATDLRRSGLDMRASRMPLSGAAWGLEADIHTNLPIKIECKNQETWKPLEYYEQAKANSFTKMPIVVMSRNYLPEPLAIISWNDLLALMEFASKGGWVEEPQFSKRKQVGK